MLLEEFVKKFEERIFMKGINKLGRNNDVDSTISGCMTVFVRINEKSNILLKALEKRGYNKDKNIIRLDEQLCNYLLKEYSVCAVPSRCFGFDILGLRFGLGRQDFAESINILERACTKLLLELEVEE